MPGKPDEARRELARNLRRQGHSLSQIASIMGLKSTGGALAHWLRGVPPAPWTKRPRAKDQARDEAVRLRLEGRSYREIKEILGVSKGSLSLWLQEVPLTDEHRAALAEKSRLAYQRRADTMHALSRARHQRLIEQAALQVSAISEAELFIAGVVAYWAEGAKTKPWGNRVRVEFINSDPGMVMLFLRWLHMLRIPRRDLTFRIAIHETADVDAALRFWSEVTEGLPGQFLRTTLKRHNPRTTRKNVGEGYYGCLVVSVRRSADLNAQIEGWFKGLLRNLPEARTVVEANQPHNACEGLGHTETQHSRVV